MTRTRDPAEHPENVPRDDDRPPTSISSDHVTISNAIFGYGGRQYFRDPRTRRWIILSAISTIAAIIVAILISTLVLLPEDPHEVLEVTATAVGPTEQISGVVRDRGDPTAAPADFKLGTTPIDVTFKNKGIAPALLTEAKINVLDVERLDDCIGAGGGPSEASMNYSAPIPVPPPSLPYRLNNSLRFEIKGESVDRLTYTVGPDKDTVSFSKPYLIVVHLAFAHDNSSHDLEVGTFAVANDVTELERQITEGHDMNCVKRNSDKLDKIYSIQAVRAGDIDKLRERYNQLLTPDPAPAKESCRGWQDSYAIPKLCAKYTREELLVKATLAGKPTVNQTMIVIPITADDPNRKYRITAAVLRSTAGDILWDCHSIEDDPQRSRALGSRSVCDLARNQDGDIVLTIRAELYAEFNEHSLNLNAEFRQKVGDTYQLAGASPADSPLLVERGN